MFRAIFAGGLSGGIILFFWGFVSWEVLPWHKVTLEKFTDEAAVAKVITENATEPGVYLLPSQRTAAGASAEEVAEAKKIFDEKMKSGPVIFAAVKLKGGASMVPELLAQFLNQFLAAVVVSLMVRQLRHKYYPSRVLLVILFGVAAALTCHVPHWIWFGFSTEYAGVAIADTVVGWSIAGVVIAWTAVAKPKPKTD